MRKTKLYIGISIVTVFITLSLFAPFLTRYTYLETNINYAYTPPCLEFILGTDSSGRDVFTRLIYGGRISIFIGFMTMIFELFIGLVVGMVSGLSGKKVDRALMNFSDIVLCLPTLCIVLILGAVLADLKVGVFQRAILSALLIAILGWPVTARLIRARVIALKQSDFMKATQILQLPLRRRLFVHLLPNLAPQITASVATTTCGAILAEATISFLGFGVAFPYPSWGNMVSSVSSKIVMFEYWWVWIPPAVSIVLLVLGINLIGENLFE